MFAFPRRGIAALLAAGALLAACGPRLVREAVFERSGTRVVLRQRVQGGEPLPQGFAHPAVISSVRLAHILARVDVRVGGGAKAERLPAVPSETLYDIADGLSAALARASADQEIAVQSLRRTRRLGIFTQDHLTAFVAYVKGESLYLHFSHVDWPVPKGPDTTLPEPRLDREQMAFRVLPEEGLEVVGAQAVSAVWRDALFGRPDRVRVGPGGRVERRTILLESPEGEEQPADGPP